MNWFEEWFNSPYYSILYKNRDEQEAEKFLKNLVQELPMKPPSKVLDIACGKGRHSRFLHRLGFDVTGIDLSSESILSALAFEEEGLRFFEADMRNFHFETPFDFAINLFTSFGYFNSVGEDEKVFRNIYDSLHPQGVFIQDYLNAEYVRNHLKEEEEKTIDGIVFSIHKKIEDAYVIKEIRFEAEGKPYFFIEKVKLYSLAEFENLAHNTGFKIDKLYGDYSLNHFDFNLSPRLILTYIKK